MLRVQGSGTVNVYYDDENRPTHATLDLGENNLDEMGYCYYIRISVDTDVESQALHFYMDGVGYLGMTDHYTGDFVYDRSYELDEAFTRVGVPGDISSGDPYANLYRVVPGNAQSNIDELLILGTDSAYYDTMYPFDEYGTYVSTQERVEHITNVEYDFVGIRENPDIRMDRLIGKITEIPGDIENFDFYATYIRSECEEFYMYNTDNLPSPSDFPELPDDYWISFNFAGDDPELYMFEETSATEPYSPPNLKDLDVELSVRYAEGSFGSPATQVGSDDFGVYYAPKQTVKMKLAEPTYFNYEWVPTIEIGGQTSLQSNFDIAPGLKIPFIIEADYETSYSINTIWSKDHVLSTTLDIESDYTFPPVMSYTLKGDSKISFDTNSDFIYHQIVKKLRAELDIDSNQVLNIKAIYSLEGQSEFSLDNNIFVFRDDGIPDKENGYLVILQP